MSNRSKRESINRRRLQMERQEFLDDASFEDPEFAEGSVEKILTSEPVESLVIRQDERYRYHDLLQRYRSIFREEIQLRRRFGNIFGDDDLSAAIQVLDAERDQIHRQLLSVGTVIGLSADYIRLDILNDSDMLSAEYGVDLDGFGILHKNIWDWRTRIDQDALVDEVESQQYASVKPRIDAQEVVRKHHERNEKRFQHTADHWAEIGLEPAEPEKSDVLLVFDPLYAGDAYYEDGSRIASSVENFRELRDRGGWEALIKQQPECKAYIISALRHDWRRRRCESFARFQQLRMINYLAPTHLHGPGIADSFCYQICVAIPEDRVDIELQRLAQGADDYSVAESYFQFENKEIINQIEAWAREGDSVRRAELSQVLQPLVDQYHELRSPACSLGEYLFLYGIQYAFGDGHYSHQRMCDPEGMWLPEVSDNLDRFTPINWVNRYDRSDAVRRDAQMVKDYLAGLFENLDVTDILGGQDQVLNWIFNTCDLQNIRVPNRY